MNSFTFDEVLRMFECKIITLDEARGFLLGLSQVDNPTLIAPYMAQEMKERVEEITKEEIPEVPYNPSKCEQHEWNFHVGTPQVDIYKCVLCSETIERPASRYITEPSDGTSPGLVTKERPQVAPQVAPKDQKGQDVKIPLQVLMGPGGYTVLAPGMEDQIRREMIRVTGSAPDWKVQKAVKQIENALTIMHVSPPGEGRGQIRDGNLVWDDGSE